MIFSETLNDADSDTEFEKELAELLNDDIADLPAIVPQTNSEVEKLEQRLNDLRVEGNYNEVYYLIFCEIIIHK